MGTLIDASVLIAAERGQLDPDAWLRGHGEESVALASITASELLHGVHRAPAGARRRSREAFVERLLAEVPVLPFDLIAARAHASLWAELAARGTVVGAHDLLIAATAIGVGYTVATHDMKSFPKIPGLAVERW
jgi:predicted nucleic acid-binding protein